jgi:tetratricopeptide (TPR) repeat protein
LLSLVEAHRDCLATLFRKAASDPVRSDIGALLGETSIVASRLWSAKGNRSLAVAHCAYARQLADSLNDQVLGAIARIFESNLHSEAATLIGADGDVVLGLRILEEAAAVSHVLTPAARARIAAEQAQAYAVLKLRRECQEALGRARRAVEDIDDNDRTGLFSDWSPSRLLVYEGTCWLFLRETEKAVGALNQALRESESDHSNVNVLLAARVDLASAYAESGELEEGCKILAETYFRLTDTGNRRGIERARCARKRLGPWENEREVRELDERISSRELQ